MLTAIAHVAYATIDPREPKRAGGVMESGIELIDAERKRQIAEEHFTAAHDDEHDQSELSRAAACYATPSAYRFYKGPPVVDEDYVSPPVGWPWGQEWWKPVPNDRVRELVKAGALIAAEIDRLCAITSDSRELNLCGGDGYIIPGGGYHIDGSDECGHRECGGCRNCESPLMP